MVKNMIKNITQEQREEILRQGRQEGRENFFKTNRKFFRYPSCQMPRKL